MSRLVRRTRTPQLDWCRRTQIERHVRRLKGFRRNFSRYDKLDDMFTTSIRFVLIVETLRPQAA